MKKSRDYKKDLADDWDRAFDYNPPNPYCLVYDYYLYINTFDKKQEKLRVMTLGCLKIFNKKLHN